jgi:hypothetical protein
MHEAKFFCLCLIACDNLIFSITLQNCILFVICAGKKHLKVFELNRVKERFNNYDDNTDIFSNLLYMPYKRSLLQFK